VTAPTLFHVEPVLADITWTTEGVIILVVLALIIGYLLARR